MSKLTSLILCAVFFTQGSYAQVSPDSTQLFNQVSTFKLVGIQKGSAYAPVAFAKPFSLFVFLSPECPLCQNYSIALRNLSLRFGKEVNMYGIVPGNAYTKAELRAFENKYRTGLNILVDEQFELTKYLQAAATPQAILLDKQGQLLYTGAIDDWVYAQGKKKIKATQHFLQDAIKQSLQHTPVKINKTKAVGCRINDH